MDMEEPLTRRADKKLQADFRLCRGLAPLTPELFWDQLYYQKR